MPPSALTVPTPTHLRVVSGGANAIAPAPPPSPPYPLTPDVAAFIGFYAATSRDFYARLGGALEATSIAYPDVRLLLLASQEIAREAGHGPGSAALVLQRIRRWQDQGTHTADELVAAATLLDTVADRIDDGTGVVAPEGIVRELVPLLQERARRAALMEGHLLLAAGSGAALHAAVASRLAAAESIGDDEDDIGDGWDDAETSIASIQGLPHCRLGVEELDALLLGGPHEGSYTIWAAGTGGSKTTSIVHAACTGLLQGHNVLIATCETPKWEVWCRVLSNLSGIPLDAVRTGETAAMKVVRALKERGAFGNIRLKEFEDGVVTVESLRRWRDSVQQKLGMRFGWVGVDGIDQLTAPGWKQSDGTYELGKVVGKALDTWAKDTKDPLYLHATSHVKRGVTYTQKAADGTRVPGKDDLADSQHRARKAHYLITNTAVTNPETLETSGYFHIAKSRFSRADIVVGPLPMDLGCARIVRPVATNPGAGLPFAPGP